MSPQSPNDRLAAALRALPPVEAQNRLMRLGDREIALSMMYMKMKDRGALLALLPAPKARRIADELIRNTYRVLMTRGMRGCYVFCTDSALREYLRDATPDSAYPLPFVERPAAAEEH